MYHSTRCLQSNHTLCLDRGCQCQCHDPSYRVYDMNTGQVAYEGNDPGLARAATEQLHAAGGAGQAYRKRRMWLLAGMKKTNPPTLVRR
jgi:hypothetical protein